jgi:hypothetical protein
MRFFITFRTVDSAIKFLQSSLPLQQNKLECFYLARYFFKLLAGKAAAKSTLVVSTHFKALLKNIGLIRKKNLLRTYALAYFGAKVL